MSGVYTIVQQLYNTHQPTAVGIGHFLKALLDSSRPTKMPITVEYVNKEGTKRVMMFSRQVLTTNYSNAMQILRRDLSAMQKGYHNLENITVTGALFYNEDGTVQETLTLISQESWPDLMAHVHKIFVRASGT